MYKIVMITVTYNAAPFLTNLISSTKQALNKYYIDCWIFIDCNSVDGTLELLNDLKNKYKELNILIKRENANLGYAKGIERAITYINKFLNDKTLLIICNQDGYFGLNALDNLIDCFKKGKEEDGIIQPLVLRTTGRVDSAGNLMSRVGLVCPAPSLSTEFFYLTGACFITSYLVYKTVGKMDVCIFMGADDLDFSWRVRLAGFSLKVCKNSIFYHISRSGFKLNSKRLEWRTSSILWSMIKCMPYSMLTYSLPLYLFLHFYIALVLSLYNRMPCYIASFFRAIYFVLKNIRILFNLRIVTRNIVKKAPDKQVLRYLSPTGYVLKIAFNRYLKG